MVLMFSINNLHSNNMMHVALTIFGLAFGFSFLKNTHLMM